MIRLSNIVLELTSFLNDTDRIHISKTPIKKLVNYNKQQQISAMKPLGFWYGFGKNWLLWCKENLPSSLGRYVYRVNIRNESKLLKIKNVKELIEFDNVYRNENQEEKISDTINWYAVSKNYNGIEINPILNSSKYVDYLWCSSWDIASGCLWNVDNVELELLHVY